jgi:hypothetical protein
MQHQQVALDGSHQMMYWWIQYTSTKVYYWCIGWWIHIDEDILKNNIAFATGSMASR